jgi:hypothetical protein
MKIYFCDLCNESIPQEDLEQNRVTSVRGKMICARCVPSIAGAPGGAPAAAPAAAAAAAAAVGGGRMVAVVALLLAGFGLYLGWNANGRLDRQDDPGPRLAALDKTVSDAGARVAQLDETLRAESSARERSAADVSKLREENAAHLARLEGIERDVGAIRKDLAILPADREKIIASIDAKQGQFEAQLDALQKELKDAQAKIAAAAAEPKAAPAAAPGAAPAKDPTPTLDPETKKLLADFNGKEPSVRWTALDHIAKRHDPTLLPYLMPMLDDADAFVQFRAIQAMRELNAKTAVGHLVKLLRDNDVIVRGEAQDALITLTGNPMRFDFENGAPAEREKGAKAWEEWYEKNKARFEEPAAPAAPANG